MIRGFDKVFLRSSSGWGLRRWDCGSFLWHVWSDITHRWNEPMSVVNVNKSTLYLCVWTRLPRVGWSFVAALVFSRWMMRRSLKDSPDDCDDCGGHSELIGLLLHTLEMFVHLLQENWTITWKWFTIMKLWPCVVPEKQMSVELWSVSGLNQIWFLIFERSWNLFSIYHRHKKEKYHTILTNTTN